MTDFIPYKISVGSDGIVEITTPKDSTVHASPKDAYSFYVEKLGIRTIPKTVNERAYYHVIKALEANLFD